MLHFKNPSQFFHFLKFLNNHRHGKIPADDYKTMSFYFSLETIISFSRTHAVCYYDEKGYLTSVQH